MYKTTTGLVLRETNFKEADKILTVLTQSDGKVTVSARGVRRKGSRMGAAAQLLTFSEMTLFGYKGRWSLNEAATIELFDGVRSDIVKLSLGSYFAELLEAVADEDAPNPELLSLGLNALYALGCGKYNDALIKAAFELRLMCLAGYAPDVQACVYCGNTDYSGTRLDLHGGAVYCKGCLPEGETPASVPLCPASLAALRHITDCDPKKIFAFRLGAEAAGRLGDAAEAYLLAQLERGFHTLDFYKDIGQTIPR
jgi:DNA repair protein RecO (recombination protein O)